MSMSHINEISPGNEDLISNWSVNCPYANPYRPAPENRSSEMDPESWTGRQVRIPLLN